MAAAPVSRETVLQWLRDGTAGPGGSIVLVDVRRNDFEVCSLSPTPPSPWWFFSGGLPGGQPPRD